MKEFDAIDTIITVISTFETRLLISRNLKNHLLPELKTFDFIKNKQTTITATISLLFFKIFINFLFD